ncbi:5-carboxymethyl-2-hydroxymuconate Delta-isomerase [Salsuginibacillus kocurii]|uniref:5-carboxymethyl-2-hydroxymuconate Delta-isomerase n=1 Tax=Salsuginibacillus kocurii TaxID=427078 RepID=UPI0003746DB6|nr:5-carboxymethyl-2-hydroxymuconate Delta-isomerase [Salsuginibacillus kocurii]
MVPHLIIEYTKNLEQDLNINDLLKAMHAELAKRTDIFPLGGIRVRAYPAENYIIADGQEEDAFIHAALKIGGGRSDAEKNDAGKALFAAMTKTCQAIYEQRYLGLSLEISEFTHGTYKKNNIHARFS